jgi:hypothetical protein
MIGKTDFAEACGDTGFHIVTGMTGGMLAKRGMHVVIETHGGQDLRDLQNGKTKAGYSG